MDPRLPGVAAGVASGLLFGLSDALIRAATRGIPPRGLQLLSLLAGAPVLLAVALLHGGEPPAGEALQAYAAAGVLNFAVGRLLFYIAVAGLGAATASVVTSPTILVASLLASLLLGEPLTPRLLSALLLSIAGAVLASARPSGEPRQGLPRGAALAAGAGSVLAFSASAVLVRLAGLRGGDPLWGSAVSYLAALPVALPLGLPPLARGLRSSSRGEVLAGLAGVVVVALAQLSRYAALTLLPVAAASVLISLFPVHTLLFTRLLARETGERATRRHAAGAILAVAGALLGASA